MARSNLRKDGAKWVRENIGEEYVDEFYEKYDKLNNGIPIGGFVETAVFLDMLERIKRGDSDENYNKHSKRI